MLLARYAPIDSTRYEKLTQAAKAFDKINEWLPAQLFAFWTIFVAGMANGKAQTDRFYFWDWNGWLIGLIGIIIITLIIGFLGNKQRYIPINNISASFKSIWYHLALSYVFFGVGYLLFTTISIINAILYVIAYLAVYLIHSIKVEKSERIIILQNEKNVKTGISIVLLTFSGIIGYVIEDPVLSTASIVSLPFLVVLLFGRDLRHLERAKFYPIFIFAMFVVSREAWFLIPLLLLFFILRSYNYLRYQKIYPTFGVTDDQN
jgi:hypothetical protein